MKELFAQINNSMKENLSKLVDSKEWNVYRGKYVNAVEEECGKILGAMVLTTNSGSSSLELCLRTLEINEGDEVIIPSFTFVATAQAIMSVGATPVLCRTDPDTFNLSYADVEKKINKKTKAIIFVHLFGNPSGVEEISKICKKNKIYLVEDCAQGFGAKIGGKSVGTFGDCAAFSFNSCKHLSCGDGGAFVTTSKALYLKCKGIRHAGLLQNKKGEYVAELVGGKNLMTEFQAAVLLPQLEKWNELFNEREKVGSIIRNKLIHEKYCVQKSVSGAVHSYQRIVFLAKNKRYAQKLFVKNKFLEKIYERPLCLEPIIIKKAKIDSETKKEAIEFWERHLGITLQPFTDYLTFAENFKVEK